MKKFNQEQILVQGIFSRIRSIYGVKNNAELANALNIDASYCSQNINRGSIPWKLIYQICLEKGVSLDFLVFSKTELDIEFLAEKAGFNLVITNIIDESKKPLVTRCIKDTFRAPLISSEKSA